MTITLDKKYTLANTYGHMGAPEVRLFTTAGEGSRPIVGQYRLDASEGWTACSWKADGTLPNPAYFLIEVFPEIVTYDQLLQAWNNGPVLTCGLKHRTAEAANKHNPGAYSVIALLKVTTVAGVITKVEIA